jgi:cytochrome b subunit of formate dehydrogenase
MASWISAICALVQALSGFGLHGGFDLAFLLLGGPFP